MTKAPIRAPKDWPADLRKEFETPIAVPPGLVREWEDDKNMASIVLMQLGESLRKLSMLGEHYKIAPPEPGQSGSVRLLMIAMHLCCDMLPGFQLKWPARRKGKKMARVWTPAEEIALVYRVNQVMKKTGKGIESACKIVAGEFPEYHKVKPYTLKRRFLEAKSERTTFGPQDWIAAVDKLAPGCLDSIISEKSGAE